MANREEHAASAEVRLKQAERRDIDGAMISIESAKVEATLALAAAISEIAQNLWRITR